MRETTLADLRNGKGMTQRNLAKSLSISPGTVAMYEVGARTPSLEMAKRIARFFGVPVEAIIFGQGAHETRLGRAPGA